MTQIADNDLLIIGKIGAPYGVKGWVKITSYTSPVTNIMNYKPWFIKHNKQWVEIKVEDIRPHTNTVVAKLTGVNDKNLAELYTHNEIAITREQLPELAEGDYYWQDLIGLTVIDQDNNELGVIDGFLETGANDVIVVKKDKEEILIPFVMDSYIKAISLDEKIMRVFWLTPE